MNGKRAEIKNGSHIFSATSSFILLLLLHGIKALKVLALSVLSFLRFLRSPTTFFSFLPLSASSVCRLIHLWHFRQILFFFRLVHSFSPLFSLARYFFFASIFLLHICICCLFTFTMTNRPEIMYSLITLRAPMTTLNFIGKNYIFCIKNKEKPYLTISYLTSHHLLLL